MIGIETWNTYFVCRFTTLLFGMLCIYLFLAQLFLFYVLFDAYIVSALIFIDSFSFILSHIVIWIITLIGVGMSFFLTVFIVLLIGEKYSDSYPQFFCPINRRILAIYNHKDDNNESNWEIIFDGKSFDLSEWQEQLNSSIVTWKGQEILMEKTWGNQWESIKKTLSNKQ